MPIYTSSKGEEKDTAEMPTTYIRNALRKAQEAGNQANIEALEAELETRGESATADDANTESSAS